MEGAVWRYLDYWHYGGRCHLDLWSSQHRLLDLIAYLVDSCRLYLSGSGLERRRLCFVTLVQIWLVQDSRLVSPRTKRRHELVYIVRTVHHLEEEEFVPPSTVQGWHVSCVALCTRPL